ncbi:MAG: FG-GAP repeat domain-containing protein [Acidobacteriota bacterium]
MQARSVAVPFHEESMARPRFLLSAALVATMAFAGHPFAAPALSFRPVSIDLPGPPAALVPVDLDDDDRVDLFVVLVYTEYDEITFEQTEGFVQMTEIVPALFERREARAYLQQPDGSYDQAGEPMRMPRSVLAIAAGPPGLPLIALTDEGVGEVRLAAREGGPAIRIDPLIADRPVLRGAGSFLPRLDLVRDLDGDGAPDLLLPAVDGPAVYRATGGGLDTVPAARLVLPGDTSGLERGAWRRYPLPRVEDVDGDGRPDLLLVDPDSPGSAITVLLGTGGGGFSAPLGISTRCLRRGESVRGTPELAFFGDLDGRGRAEAVLRTELESEKGVIKGAKRPHYLYQFHRLREDLTLEPTPYRETEIVGYEFGTEWPRSTGGEFRDLDGDGRKDLVTVTLDFSMFQILRILATKRLGIGLKFHVWSQGPDGRFVESSREQLEDKLLLDFNDLKLDRLDHFTGDFDGDGRIDFISLKRSKKLAIHLGRPGSMYGTKPDVRLTLKEKPRDMALVRVLDLNGDGRADLAVTNPLPAEEDGATAPVRLDVYFSEVAR